MRASGRWAVPLLAAALLLPLIPAAAAAEEMVAELVAGRGVVKWKPMVEYERIVLVVTGPELRLRKEFAAGETPHFELPGVDGAYKYELRVTPPMSPELKEKLASQDASGRGLDDGKSPVGPGPVYQAGSFAVLKGAVVRSSDEEPEPRREETAIRQQIPGDLEVLGDLAVRGTKKFVADHPEDPGRSIVYIALEGPEAGTYFRGSAVTAGGEAVIELPEHFAAVTESAGLTVQLTPLGGWARLYVAEKSPRRLVIRDAEGGDGIEFDFLVQGVRRGYAGFQADRESGAGEPR